MALEAQETEKKSSGVKIRVDTAVDEYMSGGDNRSENANMGVTPNGLLFTVGGLALNRDNLKRLEDAGFSRLVELHRTGGVHIHDLSLGYCTPYCIGLSLENLIVNGLNAGPVPSAPARHFRTVINHIVNCIGSVCNEVAGAIAFNDIDVYLGAYAYKYYLDKKKQGVSRNIAFKLTKEEIKQSLQELVFHLNQTNRFGGQTPFSNITLAMRCPDDMKEREAIIGDKRLIDCFSYHDDGIRVNHTTYGELEEWQALVASTLLDVYIEGSHDKRGFTFPVLTINVTNDFLDSSDIAHIRERVWKLTSKYGTPFFQNFVSGVTSIDKKLSPKDVRSMCPMHKDTMVPVMTLRGLHIRPVSEIFNTYLAKGTKYRVLHNGNWISATPTRIDSIGLIKISTSNGVSEVFDLRHEQPIIRNGERVLVSADSIEVGDYIPFAGTGIEDRSENYDAGFAVGAFVGDGSFATGRLIYSLSVSDKKEKALLSIKAFFETAGFSASVARSDIKKLVSLYIGSGNLAARSWMEQFVAYDEHGDKYITKRSFQMGGSFLQGLLDGWYATDGGNRGRIYTSSKHLVSQFCTLCSLLGIHFTIGSAPDTRSGRLGDRPVYTCKFHTRDKYGDEFFKRDGLYWFKVSTLEKITPRENEDVYCFVVDSDENLFQLASGLITHNCRLSLDLQDLRSHTGGLFGNGDSTGSLQVVTVSLPFLARYAIEASTDENHLATFFRLLDEWMNLIKEEQLWKRKVVNKSFEDGFFPMCAANLPRKFETFFTTIGFVGVQECVSMLLGDPDGIVGEEGLALGAEILTRMKENIEKFINETGTLFNLEATPAESASHKLAKKALKSYPDIDHRGLKKAPYFTNSHTLPVELQDDLGLVFKTQSVLQTIPSGGTVQHFYITEDMSPKDVEEAVRMICDTKIPYFGLSMVYSVCPICGRVPGAHETCPNVHTLEQLEELKAKNPALVLQ